MTWIETYSGKKFDLLDPTPDQVDLRDIAHALARINRFTGHTSPVISVAEHSLWVHALVLREHPEDPLLLAHALLHDAAEACVGDVSAPLKLAMREKHGSGLTWFDTIELEVQAVILEALGLPMPAADQKAIIRRADLVSLVTERRVFMPHTGAHPWGSREDIPVDETLLADMRNPGWRRATVEEIAERFLGQALMLLAMCRNAGLLLDRSMCCPQHGVVPHRWMPSPDAGPGWRCSECGGLTTPV
jgi:hypothetical protein